MSNVGCLIWSSVWMSATPIANHLCACPLQNSYNAVNFLFYGYLWNRPNCYKVHLPVTTLATCPPWWRLSPLVPIQFTIMSQISEQITAKYFCLFRTEWKPPLSSATDSYSYNPTRRDGQGVWNEEVSSIMKVMEAQRTCYYHRGETGYGARFKKVKQK